MSNQRSSGREEENQREEDFVITVSSFFQRHLLWVHEIGDEVADLPGGEGAEEACGHDGVGELACFGDPRFFEGGFLGETA